MLVSKGATSESAEIPRPPIGLGARGRRLWREMHALVEFNPAETVLLEEACRMADRLARIDATLRGKSEFVRLRVDEADGDAVFVVDALLSEARQQANVLKQLIAALRLPDEMSEKRPQRRAGARGVGAPRLPSGVVATGGSAKARLRFVG